jgi:hypothetical protein
MPVEVWAVICSRVLLSDGQPESIMPTLVQSYTRSRRFVVASAVRFVVAIAAGVASFVLVVHVWWLFTSSNNKGKIEGKWSLVEVDGLGTHSFLAGIGGGDPDRGPSPGDFLRERLGEWKDVPILEFGKDMELELFGSSRSGRCGTYSLGTGNDVTLKLGRSKDHVVKVVINGHKLTMTERHPTDVHRSFTMYFKKVE